MAQVYSSALGEFKEVEGSQVMVTEGGKVTVVRCIDVFHGFQVTPVAGRVVGPGGAAFFGYYSKTPFESLTQQWFGWRGRQVFRELEEIVIHQISGNADWRLSGYLLNP